MRHVILFSMVFVAVQLHAHPGHSPLEHGLSHALLSPNHFLLLLATGAILLVVGRFVQPRRAALVLKSLGAAVIVVGATGLLSAL